MSDSDKGKRRSTNAPKRDKTMQNVTSTPDLNSFKHLPLEEIQEMQTRLAELVESRVEARKEEAIAQVISIVQEHDISFDEIVARLRPLSRRGKAPALYRNPAKPKQTWSGKGLMPDWLKEYDDIEDCRIPGTEGIEPPE